MIKVILQPLYFELKSFLSTSILQPKNRVMTNRNHEEGWIELIWGCMFSGKTEELIRRARRCLIADQNVFVFKPSTDDRFSEEKIETHDGENLACSEVVDSAEEIMAAIEVKKTDVVAIDEAQFFGEDLIECTQKLANDGIKVIVAGLDLDYKEEPFTPVPGIAALAEETQKLHAVCENCGHEASRSFRIKGGEKQQEVGASEKYKALCRTCFQNH